MMMNIIHKSGISFLAIFLFLVSQACGQDLTKPEGSNTIAPEVEKIQRSDKEWKEKLSDETYYIMREAGTESAFTGKYWKHKEKGTYRCASCGLTLFTSEAKFDSSCGWPSFYQAVKDGYVLERPDFSFGMKRIEVICARCEGHLGHVFDDGPAPTGLRYCINSPALIFSPVK